MKNKEKKVFWSVVTTQRLSETKNNRTQQKSLYPNISGENNGIKKQVKNEYLKKMIHKYTTVVLSIALLNSDSLSFK